MSNVRLHSREGFTYRQRSLRLDPNNRQATALARACGTRRWTYNWALEQQLRTYRETGTFVGPSELMHRIVELKRTPEHAWLGEVSKCAPQAAISDLHQALMSFLLKRRQPGGKVGFPRFKKKGAGRESVRLHGQVRLREGHVTLPRIGRVRIRPAAPELGGRICSVTCYQEAGNWYVSLRLEVPAAEPPPPPPEGEVIGLDLGVRTLAVDSDGRSYPGARALRASLRRLARAQREMSRKQPGSRNRERSRRRLQRRQARVRRQRADHLHKITTHLARTKQVIVIEDLAVDGMLKSRWMSRSLADQSLGLLRRQLEYKCQANGVLLVVAPRFFPSSKRCSRCGWIRAELTLREREYRCENPACGAVLDRDHNAALNLRWWGEQGFPTDVAAGRAETQNACGAGVRPERGRRRGVASAGAGGEAGTEHRHRGRRSLGLNPRRGL
ncbi:MAG: transposase [Candidatus Dormibacteraeota bacterium]|nr:transposase [Candidatus Dormibacteraeota bacterium]